MGIVRASHYSCNNAPHGIAIRRWRTAWRTACQAAGVPTRFLHDCRRTAARNPPAQTSGATQRCLNPGFSERIGNSRRTGSGHEKCGPSRDSSSKLQLGCAITTKRSRQIPNVWTSQAQPAGRASLTSVDPTARLGARGSHAHLERRPAAPGTSCRATPRPLSRRPRRSGKVPGHQDRYTPQRRNQNTGSHETDEKPPTRDACLQAPVRRSRPNRE